MKIWHWSVYLYTFLLLFSSCSESKQANEKLEDFEIVVLGIAQDAGYPQINCTKECCNDYYNGNRPNERVTCLGIIDRIEGKSFLVEATPDIVSQWRSLQAACTECKISGIFITHAHIGHYTGLMQLGKEALGGQNIPVFVMPKMADFLTTNGPWSQLVEFKNIQINVLANDSLINVTRNLKIKARQVPHRDEFSETACFSFYGPNSSALFIPDIDKWSEWDNDITKELNECDYALLDGTFYDAHELPGRNINEIPHPFIVESIALFSPLNREMKGRINFIHFNHTNPIMNVNSEKRIFAENLGFAFCSDGQIFGL